MIYDSFIHLCIRMNIIFISERMYWYYKNIKISLLLVICNMEGF